VDWYHHTRPKKTAASAYRSHTESRKAPKTETRFVARASAPSSVSVALKSHRQMPAVRNQPCATIRPTDAVRPDPTTVRPVGEKPRRPRNRAGASASTRERRLSSFTSY